MAGKEVAHDPVPVYDQLTQYVYQESVVEAKGRLTVRAAVGLVRVDDQMGGGFETEKPLPDPAVKEGR